MDAELCGRALAAPTHDSRPGGASSQIRRGGPPSSEGSKPDVIPNPISPPPRRRVCVESACGGLPWKGRPLPDHLEMTNEAR